MKSNKKSDNSNTAKCFHNLSLICFYSGTPYFWMTALPFPKKLAASYRTWSEIISVLVYGLILSEFVSLFTQKNLSLKQESDQMVYIMSHPMLWSYSVSFCSHADIVRKILVDIMKLKEVYSDIEVEKKMIKNSKLYSLAFCGMCAISMLMYTFDAIMIVVKRGGTFTTLITAWPLVEDRSVTANMLRVFWNVLWWCMMIRVLSVYAFVFSLTSCMSHQFIDLQSYFLSLGRIFENDRFNQTQKEHIYEESYKIGIKLHSDSLQCVQLSKIICGWLFSGQIIFNITMLVLLMAQLMKAERNLMHVGAIGIAAFCIILGTGLFMCNAGDVTVENLNCIVPKWPFRHGLATASELSRAMYLSGWEYCRGVCSVRVRKLVMTSMIYAQRPVVITGLGIMSLSYQSYVSLVKSTYSVFSLVFQQTQ